MRLARLWFARILIVLSGALLSIGGGCARPPYLAPFPAEITRPGNAEKVVVDRSILIVDASGSVDIERVFPREKALLEAYVAGMPPGTYDAGIYVLGGRERDQLPLARFDRWSLGQHAHELRYVGRETPLAGVLEELAETLDGSPDKTALVIFSDGFPTHYGKYVGPEETFEAARVLAGRPLGELCYHMIWIGADPRGSLLLNDIAQLTDCGSYHTLDDLSETEALAAFQRDIYIGPAPLQLPTERAIVDLDRDGVDDRFDRCARTPFGAQVDERGCWVIQDYVFATNAATILEQHRGALDAVVEVLERNPTLRVRLDGHTDDTGTAAYNFELAERRAGAVSAYLQAAGIDATRLKIRGFGPSRPIAANDTPEGRSKNRRVELSVIDW
jgi:OOP family OmpA-OmpF porin